jgi:CHAT domain-containing protein
MRAFYKNLQTMPKMEALRQAQLSMIKGDSGTKARSESAWSHPFYWAPFILVGDWK